MDVKLNLYFRQEFAVLRGVGIAYDNWGASLRVGDWKVHPTLADEIMTNEDCSSDSMLLSYVVRKDAGALASLYGRHRSLLYSLALRIMGDAATAEEVLQDTFFQLWQKAGQFDSARGPLIGWLLAITRHRAISRIRERGGWAYREPLSDEVAGARGGAESTILEQLIARQLITSALAGLPKAQREAITLAYFDGLTCEEIAIRTRAPLGTTKSRLRSALGTMKRALSKNRFPTITEDAIERAALEDILITEQLDSRPRRSRSAFQESDALDVLAQATDASAQKLIDSFLQLPLQLCGAGTSGLSILETNAKGEELFRWTHLAGELGGHVGGTTPREFSPCGVTLNSGSPQLFEYPARYFHYFNNVKVPITEGLVIPFHVGTKTQGTVWVLSHDDGLRFDSEDVRIMTSLAEFVGCALHLMNESREAQAPTSRADAT